MGDVSDAVTDGGGGDAGVQGLLGGGDEFQVGGTGGADGEADRGVAGPAVEFGPAVDADQVAVAQAVVVGMPCTTASLTEAQITAGKGMGAKEGW